MNNGSKDFACLLILMLTVVAGAFIGWAIGEVVGRSFDEPTGICYMTW